MVPEADPDGVSELHVKAAVVRLTLLVPDELDVALIDAEAVPVQLQLADPEAEAVPEALGRVPVGGLGVSDCVEGVSDGDVLKEFVERVVEAVYALGEGEGLKLGLLLRVPEWLTVCDRTCVHEPLPVPDRLLVWQCVLHSDGEELVLRLQVPVEE